MRGTERKSDRLLAAVQHRPIRFIFILFVLWCAPVMLIRHGPPTDLGGAMLREGGMGLLAVLLLTRLRWWREAGFTAPDGWRCLWIILLPALLAVAGFRGVALSGAGALVLFGLLAALAAFQEEAWHRGILLRSLVPVYGVHRAVAVSSLAFGLFQMVGILMGVDPVVTIIRAAGAGLGGYIFATVRVRTGSIWPGMIVRWLLEMVHYLGRGGLVDQHLLPSSARPVMLYSLALLVLFGISVLLVRRWHGAADEADSRDTVQAS